MKKLHLFISLLVILLLVSISAVQSFAADDTIYPGFKVEGRFLYDNTGEKVILYGVNKMSIWMDKDGVPSFSEIAKTGANSIRIVWTMDGTAEELDTVIRNCRAEHMIPMVELHDATGEWSRLPSLVDYWVRSDIVEVIKKHQEYLLVNIGNEVGNQVSDADFKSGYKTAVSRMRAAGIHVPLVIDASSYGQNIDMLQSCGPYLISEDPDKNLMFSVHMWWPYMWGNTDQRVIDEIAESVNMNLPLIVGEFGHIWDETEAGKIPYKTILEECYKNEVGYLPWEWGPGNNPQTFLDMTTDGTFDTLRGWGLEVCITSPYSIKNIAKRPASMLTNLPPALPQEPLPYGNLALNKPVVASNFDEQHYAKNIVDGDMGTRWASTVSDPNWIYVDLGSKKDINRLIICWEAAYATQYKIQVSDDANSWTDIRTEYNGKGRTEDISLTASGRYLRIYCMQRYNHSWPYSIFEIGVYGPESELSASISPTVAVFDKNPAKREDISISVSPKSNTLIEIKNGSSVLTPGTDYTIAGNTLVLKKEYLLGLPIGTTKLVLDYSGGVDPVFAVAVGDTTPPSSGVYGDANGDDVVNSIDYSLLKQHILEMITLSDDASRLVDLDRNGSVNSIDLSILKQYLLGTITELPLA
ncbi:mannan endo-1,4-beta-mannosidase [Anaerobacterium chartisolvens]|uniref:Mannan endo-1,4-beta-mannosidase n=1 Tax=Anaerobacterium chartisolvens TaxID=1297424 RepID=A0A369B8A2_9FIRM|nr:X2-like carbohydrate binding domain-containing protein [Anaerobacterium chartisolvens]RCX17535.1 mannan endo-1,4-beta-mannosidase [Anaerobacterium chartisolvens]